MTTLTFHTHSGSSHLPPRPLVVQNPYLVVAGFTGRDEWAVRQHIGELQVQGIAAPPTAPMYWVLPNWLLALAPESIQVHGPNTCGEVEPVLIRMPDGQLFVTVGSDHTDRALERTSLVLAKRTCPKVLSNEVWRMEDLLERWDSLWLRAYSGEEGTPYQDGLVAALRTPAALLEGALEAVGDGTHPLVLFLGTIPLLTAGFVFTEQFVGILEDTVERRVLRCAYGITQVPGSSSREG